MLRALGCAEYAPTSGDGASLSARTVFTGCFATCRHITLTPDRDVRNRATGACWPRSLVTPMSIQHVDSGFLVNPLATLD